MADLFVPSCSSGKVSISAQNVQSLMLSSSFLQLSKVRDACAEFLMNRLAPTNVIGVRHFADSLGCSSLVTACDKFVLKFFAHIATDSEEFLALSYQQVHYRMVQIGLCCLERMMEES